MSKALKLFRENLKEYLAIIIVLIDLMLLMKLII